MASFANADNATSQLETQLAVLGRMLEGMGRRSEIHREIDRSSYLISRTLSTHGAMSISGLATLDARKMRQVQRARERRVRELTAEWTDDDQQQLGTLLGRLNDALLQART